PKLLVNGSNDAYWATDALNLYWHDLVGPKAVLYTPNSGHQLEDFGRVLATSIAFLRAVAAGQTLPTVHWQFATTAETVTLTLAAHTPATEARLWTAHAPTQDFRPAQWETIPMRAESADEGTRFVGAVEKPVSGFRAVFGEITFGRDETAFTLSTQ